MPVVQLTSKDADGKDVITTLDVPQTAGISHPKDPNGNFWTQYTSTGSDDDTAAGWGPIGTQWWMDSGGNWTKDSTQAAVTNRKDPKQKDLSSVKFETRPDGTYALSTDPNGTTTVAKLAGLPGSAKTGTQYRSAPDGLHVLNADGSLGALTVPKAAVAQSPELAALRGAQTARANAQTGQIELVAPSTVAKNTATAGHLDAETEKLLVQTYGQYEPKIKAIMEARDAEVAANPTQAAAIAAKYAPQLQDLQQAAIVDAQNRLTPANRVTAADSVYGKQVGEADTRATEAGQLYKGASDQLLTPMLKYGIGSADMLKNAMGSVLGGASGFNANMGGAPVQVGGFLGGATGQTQPSQIVAKIRAGIASGAITEANAQQFIDALKNGTLPGNNSGGAASATGSATGPTSTVPSSSGGPPPSPSGFVGSAASYDAAADPNSPLFNQNNVPAGATA